MPLILLAIGVLLIVSGLKGTESKLGAQLQLDFTGQDNFLFWIAALGAVGAIGYVPVLRIPSRALIALILIAFLFANEGVIAKTIAAIKTSQAVPTPPAPTTTGSGSGGSGSGDNGAADAESAVSTIATVAEVAAVLL